MADKAKADGAAAPSFSAFVRYLLDFSDRAATNEVLRRAEVIKRTGRLPVRLPYGWPKDDRSNG